MDPAGTGGGGGGGEKRGKKTTLAQQIFDKACKGFRVESLPVEICKDMFQNSTYRAGITDAEPPAATVSAIYLYFSPQLLNITCIFYVFPRSVLNGL